MALITGPIFGIIFKTIANIALETIYLTSKIERTIKDNIPTDIELIIIEKNQFESATLHFWKIILDLFLYRFGIIINKPSKYEYGSIENIKLTTKTKMNRIIPEPKLPARLIIFIKLSWIAFAIVAPSGSDMPLLKICNMSNIFSTSSP